jgi:excinuclease ABC subunit A
LTIHDLVLQPIDRARDFFAQLTLPAPLDGATDLLLGEIRGTAQIPHRCRSPVISTPIGRSRTLSGGEVQRIQPDPRALGTSLVNTLFVLDEPSIGACIHATWGRVIEVMHRLTRCREHAARRRARPRR